jgi:hypothetical protein
MTYEEIDKALSEIADYACSPMLRSHNRLIVDEVLSHIRQLEAQVNKLPTEDLDPGRDVQVLRPVPGK